MSSYNRKGAQAKPTTAAGLRAQASTNRQSIFGNRSRISGLLSLNQNNYASLLGMKNPNVYSGSGILSKSTKSSSDLYQKSPYTKSTTSNLHYQNRFSYLNLNARPHVQNTESFSRSRIKSSLSVGSRSSSLQSLASSEGYAVSDYTFRLASDLTHTRL